MFTRALALAALALPPRPIVLDALTVGHARLHDPWGYRRRCRRSTGRADRGAVLKGKRYDVHPGQRLSVSGTLRVIDHPGGFVNGRFVEGWAEIRVEE